MRDERVCASKLTGDEIKRLMRRHRATIKGVADTMDITQKRVRQVRAQGIRGVNWVRDWVEGIERTGAKQNLT